VADVALVSGDRIGARSPTATRSAKRVVTVFASEHAGDALPESASPPTRCVVTVFAREHAGDALPESVSAQLLVAIKRVGLERALGASVVSAWLEQLEDRREAVKQLHPSTLLIADPRTSRTRRAGPPHGRRGSISRAVDR
jgi:hypothetical protein